MMEVELGNGEVKDSEEYDIHIKDYGVTLYKYETDIRTHIPWHRIRRVSESDVRKGYVRD